MAIDQTEVERRIKGLVSFWRERNGKFEVAYRLREMHDSNKKQGELSIAMNDGRVFIDLAIHMLSHKPPVIRVPVLDQSDPEQQAAGGSEIFLHGAQRHIDAGRFAMGLDPWQRAMADFLCSTGWWSDMNMVLKNEDGTPDFIAEVLDPAQVYPEFGFNQLNQVAHVYPATLADIQAKAALFNWEGDFSGDGSLGVEIKNLYWLEGGQVWNALIVEHTSTGRRRRPEAKVLAIPPMVREDADSIPIRTGPAGGWAVRSSRPGDRTKAQTRFGESILQSGAPLYDMKNVWATIALRKAQESVEPKTLLRSNNGRWTVGEDDLRSGVAIPVARDQDIETRETPGLTSDVANVVMPMLDAGIQRSGANDLLLGNINPNDLAGAGFALSLVEPRVLSKILPYALTIEEIGSTRDTMFIERFRDGDFSPIALSSRNDGERGIRRIYYKEWKPTDLPASSLVNWEVQVSLPDQMQQKIAIVRQAIPEGDILDLDTSLEMVLKVDDIDRVKRGIADAQLQRDPAVAAVNSIMALEGYADELRMTAAEWRERGEDQMAQRAVTAAERIERVIVLRIQSLEGSNRGQTDENGLPPETFGTGQGRELAGTLGSQRALGPGG